MIGWILATWGIGSVLTLGASRALLAQNRKADPRRTAEAMAAAPAGPLRRHGDTPVLDLRRFNPGAAVAQTPLGRGAPAPLRH